MNKRGISAVVATVLIILITVAGVTIVWTAIIPMIKNNMGFNELDGRVEIVTSGGYTVYDAESGIAIVQVKRGFDDGVMNRIKVIFSVNGSSFGSSVPAPASGLTKVYTFNLSGYGEPASVSVAPIFVVGNKEKEGSVTSDVDISSGKIYEVDDFVYELEKDYSFMGSCLEILNSGNSVGDGVYYIDTDGEGGSEPFQVYCDMTTDGGGWTMLMKATRGNTFNYNSNYWTTANILNEDEVNQDDGDAKFRTFNELNITDIMAHWPDFSDITWIKNSAWGPRTALQGFNEFRDWGIPQEQPDWNPTYFSSQSKQCDEGPGAYGTRLSDIGGYNSAARWGYRFNENGCGDWSSDDVGGGIGLVTSRSSSWQYSAGDWYSCCGSRGAERSARVEVYGR